MEPVGSAAGSAEMPKLFNFAVLYEESGRPFFIEINWIIPTLWYPALYVTFRQIPPQGSRRRRRLEMTQATQGRRRKISLVIT